MHELIAFTLSVATAFFAIMNPVANTPIFLALVDGKDDIEKRRIAGVAVMTAFVIVVCFTILGRYIFELFGITIPAFKITGGVLIFYVGFEMLQSKTSRIHPHEHLDPDDGVAVSPLAIPILAGPGTIVTAMENVTSGGLIHIVIVIAVFGLMIVLTYLAFSFGDWILKRLGQHLITVIGKLMGLILAIMGTGMAVEGVKLAFGW